MGGSTSKLSLSLTSLESKLWSVDSKISLSGTLCTIRLSRSCISTMSFRGGSWVLPAWELWKCTYSSRIKEDTQDFAAKFLQASQSWLDSSSKLKIRVLGLGFQEHRICDRPRQGWKGNMAIIIGAGISETYLSPAGRQATLSLPCCLGSSLSIDVGLHCWIRITRTKDDLDQERIRNPR